MSEILDAVRLRGGAVRRLAPRPPFAVEVPGSLRVVHLVERGPLRLRVAGRPEALTVYAGDVLLLARGDRHTLEPGDGLTGEASWLTGTFSVKEAAAEHLLSVLPRVIALRGRGQEWHDVSVRMLAAEIRPQRPGAAVMVSRILDLIFVHALRSWAGNGDRPPGWLTAASDPEIGPVLSAVHREPGRAWTLGELVAMTTMSRSTFTARFTRLLGASPAAYVATVRLDRASQLLRTGSGPIAEIARAVGYTSESAFSRAFHRQFGMPPKRWRQGG
ncbi:AraC family transcriptional regulator [Amycolatopsis bartoniae]|nr:AraC family transcriptional regulator [Amycolatopsis bartoniae]